MKVRIYQPHTHAGKRFVPPAEGMDVDLPEHDVKWLEANTKVLVNPAAPLPPPATTAKAPASTR